MSLIEKAMRAMMHVNIGASIALLAWFVTSIHPFASRDALACAATATPAVHASPTPAPGRRGGRP